jgi:hypothetical protein
MTHATVSDADDPTRGNPLEPIRDHRGEIGSRTHRSLPLSAVWEGRAEGW